MAYKQSAKPSKEKSNLRTIFTNTWSQIGCISILIGIINVFIPKLGHVMLVTFWVTVIIVFVGLAILYILTGLFRGEKIGDIVRRMGQANKVDISRAEYQKDIKSIKKSIEEINKKLDVKNRGQSNGQRAKSTTARAKEAKRKK